MKTTMSFRPTANPRRTTLASVEGFEVLPAQAADQREPRPLPESTANPRRTTLMEVPGREG
ncbi:hypothetical protein [Peterkaempfera bronchialis]|uniref:Uncharacterized protein n=1 Tax=Peterkaempfera bronchialis TaxID=2126346 RepID=A0A345T6G4_9ACTN|nr:hypothetical protein [Peterkaempfera bronchialis]AXI81569.1 hypothetical protein C7M71_021335 [Peterkaempfera bronchialis]